MLRIVQICAASKVYLLLHSAQEERRISVQIQGPLLLQDTTEAG